MRTPADLEISGLDGRALELRPRARERVVANIVRTARGAYIYDTPSNRIVKLEDPVEEILAEQTIRGCSSKDVHRVLLGLMDSERAQQRIDAFSAACADAGVLKPVGIQSVRPCPDKAEVQAYLDRRIVSVVLGVTEECSLRCRYCVYGGTLRGRRVHSSKEMSRETATKAIDFYLSRSGDAREEPAVGFYGGEPLLRPDFIAFVINYARRASRRAVTFHLTTNGLALNSRSIRNLLAREQVSLLVSHDGPPEIHDRWRVTKSGRGTSHLVQRGLEMLCSEYPDYYRNKVMFSAVLTPPASANEVVDYLCGQDVFTRSTRILRLSGVERGDSPLFDLLEDPERAARDARAIVERYVASRAVNSVAGDGLDGVFQTLHALIAQRRIEPLPAHVIPSGYCVPGGRKLFVSADGSLGVCEKVGDALKIGTLDTGFDVDLIVGLLRAMHSMWRRSCSWCVARRFCMVCPANVLKDGALSRARFRAQCAANRAAFFRAMRTFIQISESNPEYVAKMREVVLA